LRYWVSARDRRQYVSNKSSRDGEEVRMLRDIVEKSEALKEYEHKRQLELTTEVTPDDPRWGFSGGEL
jgi:hypothetical protein